jgi:hypothetical protein
VTDRAGGVRVAYPLFQAGGGGSTPTSALQLRLCEIALDTARALNQLWHSVLPAFPAPGYFASRRRVCFAAEYDGLWYAVAVWTSPVAANRLRDASGCLELRRLAIAPDAPCNTASRLLGVMARLIRRKFPEVSRLLSYQAVDVHDGTIYRAAGWTPATLTRFRPWLPRKGSRKKKHDGHRGPPQSRSDKVRWEKIILSAATADSLDESPPEANPEASVQPALFAGLPSERV